MAVALKNSDLAPTRRWKEFDDVCIRYDRIPEYDGQTDRFSSTIRALHA